MNKTIIIKRMREVGVKWKDIYFGQAYGDGLGS